MNGSQYTNQPFAYPDFSKPFVIYTDASDYQLGSVITQEGRPLAFYSRKLNKAQVNYTVTEKELLSIVETLKEFRGILLGHKLKVYTDHKNLEKVNSTASSQRAMRWRILLEEFSPEIVYIKGDDNTVADALSRLPRKGKTQENGDTGCSETHHHAQMCLAMRKFTEHGHSEESYVQDNDPVDDEPFPLEIGLVAREQEKDKDLQLKAATNKKYKKEVIMDTSIITHEGKIYVPPCLRSDTLNWYHQYMQHPGATRMYKTIGQTVYWPGLEAQCRHLVKHCKMCQLSKRLRSKYGKLPPKDVDLRPWNTVCIDCVGPLSIKSKKKGKQGKKKKAIEKTIRALTMIDPATGWIEIAAIPEDDFSSVCIAQLMNQYWLTRYPRPVKYICDDGNEFKGDFITFMKAFGIKRKATTVKNPQANGIIERVHGVINDMLRTMDLDNHEFDTDNPWGNILAEIAWAVRSLYHTTLNATPGQLVFSRDMLFDMRFHPDWEDIRKRKRAQVLKDNDRENSQRRDHVFRTGDKVLLKKDHLKIIRKTELRNEGPFTIVRVHKNGTLTITDEESGVTTTLHLRRVRPFYE